jgi:predicted nucleotidyltransferase
MTECRWPVLEEPYSGALHAAVGHVFERWRPIGIVASGTIIRGNPSPSSDLDLFVLHRVPERQRVQRFFGGVPAEIFVNPPERVERSFEGEKREGRLIVAHMLATGFVVYDADPVVEHLRTRAAQILDSRPAPSADDLVRRRYSVAMWLEDAEDVATMDADLCTMLLGKAVESAVAYRFWDARRWQPRQKDTLAALEALDPELANRVRAFYRTADLAHRRRLAREIVSQTVGATGFFEWESPVETLPE